MVAQARTNLPDVQLTLGPPEEAHTLAEQAWARRRRGGVPAESEGLAAFALARALWLVRDDEESRARALEMGARALESLTRAGARYADEAAGARARLAERTP